MFSVQYGFWVVWHSFRGQEFAGNFWHVFQGSLHKNRGSKSTETETVCWSNFWVEISWIFHCKINVWFLSWRNNKTLSLSLSDWFSPSGFFQGHWPKILVLCVIKWRVYFYFLSLKIFVYSSVLSLIFIFIFISITLFFWECHKQWYKFFTWNQWLKTSEKSTWYQTGLWHKNKF